MKRKLFIILSTLVLIITLLFSFVFKDNKENNKEISKVEKILFKPEGIEAYTLNGEKTNKEFNDLINNYVLDKITCKNGTIATYNKATNEVSLSNIHMPDYCTMNFRYTIYGRLLADNTTIKTRTDFSSVFTETNTGTLYKSTESIVGSTPKEVYYFAGNAKNNWVKFAGYYWRIIRTNHDGSIRLLYSGTSPDTTEGYIGTSAFNTEFNSPKYVGYMYGEDDSTLEGMRVNTKDSTIKTYIDNWYSNNLSAYTKYLSKDAVYCNDRNEETEGVYNTGSISFYYATYLRLNTNNAPTYNCTNSKDAFSVSNSEAKLTYPIGLMTADEITYVGGKQFTVLSSPYAWFYTNSLKNDITGSLFWWLLSPYSWYGDYSAGWILGGSRGPAYLNYGIYNNREFAIRPVISLKGNLIWKSGNGSSASPYEVEELPPTLYEKLLSDNPTIKTRADFNVTFTETNTGTIYKSTESIANSPAKDVYYFAGDTKNNWVKFGGYYWRIIRTNHDSSIRLLYSGKSPDTTDGYIENVQYFSSSHNNPISVGYMYGTAGSLDNNRQNSNDSRVKEYIDKWYSDNLSNYNNYISYDAVYCNDRELINGSTYSETNYTYYAGYNRLFVNKSPVYNCTNKKDAFSGSNSEAKLTYPIGLMTADEVAFAGGLDGTNANVYYALNSKGNAITGEKSWWLLTPKFFDAAYKESAVFVVYSGSENGRLGQLGVTWYASLRPVISIKSDTLYSKGNGSPGNPYEIVYN